MFDIGFWEVAFIGLLALLILGPSRLPEAARSAGQWIGKLRVFISNVKNDLDNQLQSDELAELRKLKNELVQAREVLQQTSGEMLGSFTEGLDRKFRACPAFRILTGQKWILLMMQYPQHTFLNQINTNVKVVKPLL